MLDGVDNSLKLFDRVPVASHDASGNCVLSSAWASPLAVQAAGWGANFTVLTSGGKSATDWNLYARATDATLRWFGRAPINSPPLSQAWTAGSGMTVGTGWTF